MLKPHIMIVDDEPPMRDLLSDFLKSLNYEVSCYATASGALRVLGLGEGKNVDAIVCDVRMSPLSGMDLLREVRSNYGGVPVLLFTAAGSKEEEAQSLSLGAEKYFVKPFSLADLKRTLERALRKP